MRTDWRRNSVALSRTTLTVWLYDSAMGAAAGEVRLKDLQELGAVSVVDAITVTWVKGAHAPRVGHLRHRTSESIARGSVLGALVGALVLAPAVGAAAGAGVAGLVDRLRGTGIDADFLNELKSSLSPGTSALLVLSDDADLDVVRPFIERGLARGDVSLLHVQLPEEAAPPLLALVRDAQRSPDPGEPQPGRDS